MTNFACLILPIVVFYEAGGVNGKDRKMTILKHFFMAAGLALIVALGWMSAAQSGALRPMGAIGNILDGQNDITKMHYRHGRYRHGHSRRYRRCHRHRSRKYRHCHTYRRYYRHRYYGHYRHHYFGPRFYLGHHGLYFGFGL